jgi:AcrR family transcriptional regulator
MERIRVEKAGRPAGRPGGDHAGFLRNLEVARREIRREIVDRHGSAVRIKKAKTIDKNLWPILDAALALANEKGFAAMSMRDLSQASGLSLGALYAYFSGKEELWAMLREVGEGVTWKVMAQALDGRTDPLDRLRTAIQTHLYLNEAMRPWFFFAYMEAKNLGPKEKEDAKRAERETEKLFARILEEGMAAGAFIQRDAGSLAGAVKALLQDWYLKPWKHAAREGGVDDYARFIMDFVEAYILNPTAKDQGNEHGTANH